MKIVIAPDSFKGSASSMAVASRIETGILKVFPEAEIVKIFKKLAAEHNKCVIVVTHSHMIASEADETFRLRKGRFEQHDPTTPATPNFDQPTEYTYPEIQYPTEVL